MLVAFGPVPLTVDEVPVFVLHNRKRLAGTIGRGADPSPYSGGCVLSVAGRICGRRDRTRLADCATLMEGTIGNIRAVLQHNVRSRTTRRSRNRRQRDSAQIFYSA